MTYAELLQQYIRRSGKSLEQIARECAQRGVQIHPTYISKLRLGKRPAPSEEISRALAEVTGGDAQRLIIKGYMEKIPDDLKDELGVYRYLNEVDDLADEITSKIKDLGGIDRAVESILKGLIMADNTQFMEELEKVGEREDFEEFIKELESDPEGFIRQLKGSEKMALLLAALPGAETITVISIEELRKTLKNRLLIDAQGNPLPNHLARPLLAHVEAIMESLKEGEDERPRT